MLAITIITPDGESINETIKTSKYENYINLDIANPKLWWPIGYGEQPLYQVIVKLEKDEEVFDREGLKIGLRTLTIKQEEDEWGESFEFEVNGVSIFAKGANYIPEHNILARCNYQKTERLIKDCVAANFNCIRVWGGGIYPEDYFYDLCDQYGLIVWQDLMFACAAYELTEAFAENIRLEVEDNMRRIRHHASLGLWCGNNENEWGWLVWEGMSDLGLKADYIKQFEMLLPKVAQEIDPNTFYWLASPSSKGSFAKPNDENYGDVHYWEVWHGRKPFTDFRNTYPRFMSEFGLQSFPSLKTIKSFTLPEDRNIFSYVMESHQKNGSGNSKIFHYIGEYFKFPKDFSSILYLSQLIQAEGIKYGVEHWRRNRGRCMGATYWQLNDCWPVASWASIDSYGRWKALHYFAKRFYAPILVSANEEETNVELHITNDTLSAIKGELVWKLRDNKSEVIQEGSSEVEVKALTAKCCESLDFGEVLATEEDKREVYLEYHLEVDGAVISNGTVLFVRAKHFKFVDPEIEALIKEDDDKFILEVEAKAYAKYVEIDFEELDLVLSDNYFDLSANQTKVLEIKKEDIYQDISLKDLKEQLRVRSLWESYR